MVLFVNGVPFGGNSREPEASLEELLISVVIKIEAQLHW